MRVNVLQSTSSLEVFAQQYHRVTAGIYNNSEATAPADISYLNSYQFKFWYSEKGCIAAIINPHIIYKTYKTGLIGFCEFSDDPSLSSELIRQAAGFLQEKGCDYCLGPLNGDTWHKYRITLKNCNERVFLDNISADYYYDHFRNNAFEVIADYLSLRVKRENFEFERIEKFKPKIEEQKIIIRSFDLNNFERDLTKIYAICIDSFRENFLYSPISAGDFFKLYQGIEKLIHPDFVLIAEQDTEALGFIFAVPDIFNTHSKGLVIKTVAVKKVSASRGLGSYMGELIHRNAYESGFRATYHLLMYETNVSTRIASSVSEVFRNYVLMGRPI